jgi:hypothetical protein
MLFSTRKPTYLECGEALLFTGCLTSATPDLGSHKQQGGQKPNIPCVCFPPGGGCDKMCPRLCEVRESTKLGCPLWSLVESSFSLCRLCRMESPVHLPLDVTLRKLLNLLAVAFPPR